MKEASLNVESNFSEENLNTENLNHQKFVLQRGNTFIKTELDNKQHIIEKLLNINSIQSNVNDLKITDNAHVNKNYVFENSNKGNPSENAKYQNKHAKPNLDLSKKKITKNESNSHW